MGIWLSKWVGALLNIFIGVFVTIIYPKTFILVV